MNDEVIMGPTGKSMLMRRFQGTVLCAKLIECLAEGQRQERGHIQMHEKLQRRL